MTTNGNGNGSKLWKILTGVSGGMLLIIVSLVGYIHVTAVKGFEIRIDELKAENTVLVSKLESVTSTATTTSNDTEYLKLNLAKFMDQQIDVNNQFQTAVTEFKVAVAELKAAIR